MAKQMSSTLMQFTHELNTLKKDDEIRAFGQKIIDHLVNHKAHDNKSGDKENAIPAQSLPSDGRLGKATKRFRDSLQKIVGAAEEPLGSYLDSLKVTRRR